MRLLVCVCVIYTHWTSPCVFQDTVYIICFYNGVLCTDSLKCETVNFLLGSQSSKTQSTCVSTPVILGMASCYLTLVLLVT